MPRATFVIEATYGEDHRDDLDAMYAKRDAQPVTAADVSDLIGHAAGDVTIRLAGLAPTYEAPAEVPADPAPVADPVPPAAGT